MEHEFLIDQRTTRRMYIGNVDVPTTKVLEKRKERRMQATKSRQMEHESDVATAAETDIGIASMSRAKRARTDHSALLPRQSSSSTSDSESSSGASMCTWTTSQSSYNTISVTNLAKAADRYDVPDTATAALASAAYLDAGIVSVDNTILVIDRSKVRRARVALRNSSVESLRPETLHAFFFDGRKDMSLKYLFGSVRKEVQDHISLVQEPRSLFLSHVTTDEGGARCLTDTIWNRLLDKNIDTSTIKGIGCDGTNVNVGRENGAIRFFELLLNTHVQWLVCLLHANELPFRVLLLKYVGKTNDPHSFCGPLGEKLKRCQTMPIVAFETMNFGGELVNVNTAVLNTDKKYLFEICGIISTGVVPENFEHRATGNKENNERMKI